MSMRFEFRLPDLGEGMVEGEVVAWHVSVGDEIREDEPMVDIMTDKATVTIPSPHTGKVLELDAKVGEVKKVGSLLIALEVGGSEVPAPQAAPASKSQPKETHTKRDFSDESTKVIATPATRRLAQDLNIDLSKIPPSGPDGRITPEDVKRFAETDGKKSQPAQPSSAGSEERIPLRGLRRKIAEKMAASNAKIPHFTYVEEADVSELVALRDQLDSESAKKNVRLTYLPFIIKAALAAIKRYPMFNAVLDEATHEIVVKHYYNIGIAAATPEGLTVPVIKDADKKDIWQLAKAINELGDKAKSGKLSLEELHGSTFTITSLGSMGGILATPIINYPEVAILGVHKIEKRPVVKDNQIVIRDMMNLSLSIDHRVIDGDLAARFAHKLIAELHSGN